MAKERKKIAENNPCIKRIEKDCNSCGYCQMVCSKLVNIGDDCIYCGQCLINCPRKAITTKYEYKRISEYLKNPKYILVASISPAVRVALGDEFGFNYGHEVTGKIVASLHQLGFDYVFDTSFGADITTIEETNELLKRISDNTNLPLFSSCCPSWTSYLKLKHPELVSHLSTVKTPIQIQGFAVKEYFANLKKIPRENIIHVAFTPCTSKKYEVLSDNNVDYALTTKELSLMINEANINFVNINDEKFDLLLSESSGTGEMFGCSSGLTNAVINNITNKDNNINDKHNTINYMDREIKCLTIYGLNNFEKHLNEINNYDFIEVMSCEAGCVGGGGQPLNPIGKLSEIRNIRKEALKAIKHKKKKLISDNMEVKYFYELLVKKNELHLK